MHPELADAIVESVRRRERQGDCPTEPAHSVETLEDCVLTLAQRLTVPRPSPTPATAGTPDALLAELDHYAVHWPTTYESDRKARRIFAEAAVRIRAGVGGAPLRDETPATPVPEFDGTRDLLALAAKRLTEHGEAPLNRHPGLCDCGQVAARLLVLRDHLGVVLPRVSKLYVENERLRAAVSLDPEDTKHAVG